MDYGGILHRGLTITKVTSFSAKKLSGLLKPVYFFIFGSFNPTKNIQP
jgi:hypothetical protein